MSGIRQMIGLPPERDPDLRAQIEGRAEMNAKLAAEINISIRENANATAKLLGYLEAINERQKINRAQVVHATYIHDGATTTPVGYTLEVPEGRWRLARIVGFATDPAGAAITPTIAITYLFPGLRLPVASGAMELQLPIGTRRVELSPAASLAAGTVQTVVFVVEHE